MTTTWNPSDVSGGITLSGGDLIATCTSSSPQGVRTTTSKDSSLGGKFVVGFRSVVLSTSPDPFDWVGIIDLSQALGTANGSLKEIILTQEGKTYSGDGSSSDQNADFSAITGTNDFDLALDFDNMKFWYRENGGAWQNSGNPATNTNGRSILANSTYFAACRLTNSGSKATIEPAPSSLPSGFAVWDAAAVTAPGSTITVTLSEINLGAYIPGASRTVTVGIVPPNATAPGSTLPVVVSLDPAEAPGSPFAIHFNDTDDGISFTPTIIPNPVLIVHFDDAALFDAWSEVFNSNVVQCVVIIK